MDPKKTQTLDPKLKEIYERVMGTPTSPSTTAPQGALTAPPPLPQTQGVPSTPQQPLKSTPTEPLAQREQNPEAPTQLYTATTGGFVAKEKSGSSLTNILLVTTAIVFFTIYALFWLRYFNLSLPFLP